MGIKSIRFVLFQIYNVPTEKRKKNLQEKSRSAVPAWLQICSGCWAETRPLWAVRRAELTFPFMEPTATCCPDPGTRQMSGIISFPFWWTTYRAANPSAWACRGIQPRELSSMCGNGGTRRWLEGWGPWCFSMLWLYLSPSMLENNGLK